MPFKDYLLQKSREIAPDLIRIRRAIHRYPELGFAENKTADCIYKELNGNGLTIKKGIGGTGVYALLNGSRGGKTVALRADMDALPIREQTGLDFASQNPGVMHACGHDAHVAVVIGAAHILSSLKSELTGSVKFIFQPCEEKPPGGALAMIESGVLTDPGIDAIFGLHVNPYMPSGDIGYRVGPMMAATDMFTLTVRGKGGHGAAPHQGVDGIVVAAQIINAFQTIPSRLVDPLQPVVVTVGTINGGYASNVLADEVIMTGTVRTLDEGLRQEMAGRLSRLAEGICGAYEATCELDYRYEYPVLNNDENLCRLIGKSAEDLLGPNKVYLIDRPSMGGEDFAFFAQRVPGCYINLGVGKSGQDNYPWHHPRFDLDEGALAVGAAVLSNAVLEFLHQG